MMDSSDNEFKSNKNDDYLDIPTKEMLSEWSVKTSLGSSTNKLSVTPEIVYMVEADAHGYEVVSQSYKDLQKYSYRVKTPESIRRKVQRHPELRFQSVFNDILGIRIEVPSYDIVLPEYLRVVDLTKGKATVDDGYRAIHAYYKESNYHYQIEIQLWSEKDYLFNSWTHVCGYKSFDSKVLKYMRELYDAGELKTYEDYTVKVGEVLCQY